MILVDKIGLPTSLGHTMFSITALSALLALSPIAPLPPITSRAVEAVQSGECPIPSDENLWIAERKIKRLLEAGKYEWHRSRLGLEGVAPSEAELVTDPTVCAEINATGPMVRDGAVLYLPFRVRGITLVVYSKAFGSGSSSAHPPGPIETRNAVLW